MKTVALTAALLGATCAFGQANENKYGQAPGNVEMMTPSILFPSPPLLVIVEPGVQVVSDYDEEVFYVDSYYWHHRGPHWYRTRVHNGGWVVVDNGEVPQRLVVYEPGRFRHWKGSDVQRKELELWHANNKATGGFAHGTSDASPPTNAGVTVLNPESAAAVKARPPPTAPPKKTKKR